MAQFSRVDMEHGTDYDLSSGEELQGRSWKPRHTLAAVLGAAALAGCGAAVSMSSASSVQQQKPQKFTARMLFESDAIHHAAAENVLNAHSKLPGMQKSKEEVKDIVSKTFRSIIENMKNVDPDAWHALDRAEMTQEQHEGVAHVMKSMKDPRVMKVGVDTAAALREAGSDSKVAQAKGVYEKLRPRHAELRALYDEVVPKSMQETFNYKPGDGFKSMLKPKKVKVLKTIGGTYYDEFTAPEKTIATTDRRLNAQPAAAAVAALPANYVAANPMAMKAPMIPQPPAGHSYNYHGVSPSMTKALEALGIIGAVAGEADTVIRVINPICKEYNHDLKINPAVTTGIGAFDFVAQVADCEIDAVADHMNPVEALGCPAMAGSAGFDALREMFTAAGVLGDNNDANGKQGNHEGESKVHDGIFDDSDLGKDAESTFPLCSIMGKCGKVASSSSGDDDDADDDDDIPPPPPAVPDDKDADDDSHN